MSAVPKRYRLVTRSDFDGLVCGMLLRELNLIDDIKFVHPKDLSVIHAGYLRPISHYGRAVLSRFCSETRNGLRCRNTD